LHWFLVAFAFSTSVDANQVDGISVNPADSDAAAKSHSVTVVKICSTASLAIENNREKAFNKRREELMLRNLSLLVKCE